MRIIGIAIIAILVATAPAYATNYYVDNTATGANDGNTGLAPTGPGGGSGATGPWQHLSKCASTLVAGDTCNVVNGSYNERVTQSTSGSSGSRITYSASAGVRARGFTVSGNYITVQGFEITNCSVSITPGTTCSSAFSSDGSQSVV